jgi:hypothetical protein
VYDTIALHEWDLGYPGTLDGLEWNMQPTLVMFSGAGLEET